MGLLVASRRSLVLLLLATEQVANIDLALEGIAELFADFIAELVLD